MYPAFCFCPSIFAEGKLHAAQMMGFVPVNRKSYVIRRKCRLPAFSPFPKSVFLTILPSRSLKYDDKGYLAE